MQELDIRYKTVLDNIKTTIQLSEELKTYLDTEEDEEYKLLVQAHEQAIHQLYEQIAKENPLQLVAFEKALLDEQFEGLYLPKALGYAVLRGRVNENVKYIRPQDHFSEILEFILNSSNFDQIKQRVGQSIQICFALSSDIWITNILASVNNKRAHSFLETQRSLKYRDAKLRNTALVKYRKQFQSLNFETAKFPKDKKDLLEEAGSLENFLLYRGLKDHNNESLSDELTAFVGNQELLGEPSYYQLCLLIGLLFELNDSGKQNLKNTLSSIRKEYDQDSTQFFEMTSNYSDQMNGISLDAEKRLSTFIDRGIEDKLTAYFNMLDVVNTKGYIHPEATNTVREYYYQNEGLSDENEAIRKSTYSKLAHFLNNLSVEEYNEYFEINKIFSEYMEIYSNQKFNQNLKDLSLKYVKKCLKHYKDKRSKEYQDIKKFVKATFVDYGFMTDKQVTELFKTKRKPKVPVK